MDYSYRIPYYKAECGFFIYYLFIGTLKALGGIA